MRAPKTEFGVWQQSHQNRRGLGISEGDSHVYLHMTDGHSRAVCTWANAQWLDPNSEPKLSGGPVWPLGSTGLSWEPLFTVHLLPLPSPFYTDNYILVYYIIIYYSSNYHCTHTQLSSLSVYLDLNSQPSTGQMGMCLCSWSSHLILFQVNVSPGLSKKAMHSVTQAKADTECKALC